MSMGPDVSFRLHGIEESLDAGIERCMYIKVFAKTRKAASDVTHLLEIFMGNDPGLHATGST